jgi:pimeloyl-ACP methyl ester carboxylesterase
MTAEPSDIGPGIRLETVVSGAVTISYFDQGQGAAILLIPSLGRGAEDFSDIAVRLAADGFRVLRPQPRGTGGSAGPMENLTLHDYAADTVAVLQQNRVEKAIIVGHAFGNFIARTIAADQPRLVGGLVLAAAFPGDPPAGGQAPSIPRQVARAISRAGDLALPREERLKALEIAFFAPGNDASVWLDGWFPTVADAQNAAQDKTPSAQFFDGGNAEVLILSAEKDVVAPPAAEEFLQNALGNRATLRSIPNAGHAMVPEQPKLVAGSIGNFARKVFER